MLSENTKKHITKLHEKKHRKEFNQFLIEGIKGVEEAVRSQASLAVVIVDGKRRDEHGIAQLVETAQRRGVAIEYCGRKDIGNIKTTDTFAGIMAVVNMPEYEIDEFFNDTPVVYLSGVRDPGNLGSIIRTTDWFGIRHILLSPDCVDVYNEKTVRASMGSLFHVHIRESADSIAELKLFTHRGYRLVALEMQGEDIARLKKQKKSVYIFGSESHGIPDNIHALCDTSATIQGRGNAESLNVAVACGIALYELQSD